MAPSVRVRGGVAWVVAGGVAAWRRVAAGSVTVRRACRGLPGAGGTHWGARAGLGGVFAASLAGGVSATYLFREQARREKLRLFVFPPVAPPIGGSVELGHPSTPWPKGMVAHARWNQIACCRYSGQQNAACSTHVARPT